MLNKDLKCIRNKEGLIAVAPHRVKIAADNLNLTIEEFIKQEVQLLNGRNKNNFYASSIMSKEKEHGYEN